MATPVRMFLAFLLVLAAACGDSADTTTTLAGPTTIGTTAPSPATTSTLAPVVPATTSTTTTVAFSMPDFTVVQRTPEDVLVVAVPPGSYTDLDIQNLVAVVVERFAPVQGLHIVDDESVAPLVLADSVTAEEQARLDEHYFLRLEDGFRMVFLGPFAEVGEVILGS